MAAKRKPLTHTTLGLVTGGIRRQVWAKSPERYAALKRTGYTCERCGAKQSKAKGREVSVVVHHKKGIPSKVWALLYRIVTKYIIGDPNDLEVLCKPCHRKEHYGK